MALAKSQQSLKSWSSQKWMTSGTHANKKRGSNKEVKAEGKKRYLPESAWDALSSGEKAATNKAKAEGNSKGKQFVSQPKGIKEKTKSYRKTGGIKIKTKKEESMKPMMYKAGGKASKTKMKMKKPMPSFMEESKEMEFGAPGVKPPVKKMMGGGTETGMEVNARQNQAIGKATMAGKKMMGGMKYKDDGKKSGDGNYKIRKPYRDVASELEKIDNGTEYIMYKRRTLKGALEGADTVKELKENFKSKFKTMADAGKKKMMGGKKC